MDTSAPAVAGSQLLNPTDFPALTWAGQATVAGPTGRMIPGRDLTPEEAAYWIGDLALVAAFVEQGYYTVTLPAAPATDAPADAPAASPIDPATGEPMTLAPVDAMAADPSAQEDHANA